MFGQRAIEREEQELHHRGFCSKEGTTCFKLGDANQKTMHKHTRGRRNSLNKNSIGTAGTKMFVHVSGGWFCIPAKQTLF